jgi:hypothetical protein
MTIWSFIIGVAVLNVVIIGWWVIRTTIKRKRSGGKLDFCDWYKANKPEIMYRIRKNQTLWGVDLEAEIDKQYQLYLTH